MPNVHASQLCVDLDLPAGSACEDIVQRFKEIYGVELPSEEHPCNSPTAENRFYRDAYDFVHHGLPTTTSWFRDLPSLRAVREVVLDSTPGRVIRILSAGCATGEETYSVLLSLWDLRDRVAVEAFDVNEHALAYACTGIYPASPGTDLHVTPGRELIHRSSHGWEVDQEVRSRVTFSHHNLLRSPYPAQSDIMLLQNVAPHFDREGKTRLLRHAVESLAPDGMLFLESIDPFDRFRDTLWNGDDSEAILTSLGVLPAQLPVRTWWGDYQPDPAVRVFRS